MTVDALMNLDMSYSEQVSKLGATAWANGFADDGAMLMQLGDNIVGESNIYVHMKPFFEQKGASLQWAPEGGGLSEQGDLGYTYGKFIRQYKDSSDKKVLETGRYLSIWRMQKNGRYKIETDFRMA